MLVNKRHLIEYGYDEIVARNIIHNSARAIPSTRKQIRVPFERHGKVTDMLQFMIHVELSDLKDLALSRSVVGYHKTAKTEQWKDVLKFIKWMETK